MANISRDELGGNDRKKLRAAVDKAMREQYGEGLEPDREASSADSILPIIPVELWKPPPPPEIKIISYTDHYTGAMLLLALGTTLAPIALVMVILASAVSGLLVAFAAGVACAFGLRLRSSNRVER
jgi:hypothetical protein